MGSSSSEGKQEGTFTQVLTDLNKTVSLKLIGLIEQGRTNNRLSKTEEELYAKALYTLARNQKSVFNSQTVERLHVLIDLIKISLNINLKIKDKQPAKKPTTNQELIQLLQISTVELFIDETNLRTLTLAAQTIEEVKKEDFFTEQRSELYSLFYWYLILYHYGDKALSIYSSKPALKETTSTLMEHTKETLKYMLGINEFAYMLIKDNATTKYLFYLCIVRSYNNK
jgi:hypothetical protein